MHSEDAVTILAGTIMLNFIASEVGVHLDIHLQGGVYMIYTPPIEQSDWLECYNHGTIIFVLHLNMYFKHGSHLC